MQSQQSAIGSQAAETSDEETDREARIGRDRDGRGLGLEGGVDKGAVTSSA
jgi:hypothetical protein